MILLTIKRAVFVDMFSHCTQEDGTIDEVDLSVMLDLRFKKTYLEQKEFDILYPGLIDQTVTLLKKLVNENKEHSGTSEKAPTATSTALR
jgi:hypothetical protein